MVWFFCLKNEHFFKKKKQKNEHLFLTVLEAGKSKMKVLADLVSGEGVLGLQTDILLLCPHIVQRKVILLNTVSDVQQSDSVIHIYIFSDSFSLRIIIRY